VDQAIITMGTSCDPIKDHSHRHRDLSPLDSEIMLFSTSKLLNSNLQAKQIYIKLWHFKKLHFLQKLSLQNTIVVTCD